MERGRDADKAGGRSKGLDKGEESVGGRRKRLDEREEPAKNEGQSIENTKEDKKTSIQQHEDIALKCGAQFFTKTLLPYLGIEGEVVGLAPTEAIYLDLKKLFQDMNVVMGDGSWSHFEFQSTNEGSKGLRRYRLYEALIGYNYNVPVKTYVLFSGNIRRPMTELKEGVNTYRIIPIIMKDRNADQVMEELRGKVARGEALTRKDLMPLLLLPLMGGKTSHKERVLAAFAILRSAVGICEKDIRRIEAILYLMADKFLEREDMEEVKEGIRMTQLGQVLVDWGREEGRKEGREEGRREGREEGRREGREEGRRKGRKEGRRKGRNEGVGEGITIVNRLCSKLIEEKRYDDLKRATEDKKYQESLFKEYGII